MNTRPRLRLDMIYPADQPLIKFGINTHDIENTIVSLDQPR
ncbi:hypothetical protein MnTg03_01435 [bacterium MnTg03]|nr:hypothetical protein MnTg03_01435 [bacterium MnTg03]